MVFCLASIQVTAYLDNIPADLVVAQDGVANLLSPTSLLPGHVEDQAQSVPGIAQVTPIVSQFTILDIHDEKVVSYMVGYEPGLGGGPWALVEGREPTDDDEVVLDWVMAQKHGFAVGDKIEILDGEFTVVGLSDGTNSWMASFFFLEKEAAERLLLTPGRPAFCCSPLTRGPIPSPLRHACGAGCAWRRGWA
jgi:putative ABC transport system permease protein